MPGLLSLSQDVLYTHLFPLLSSHDLYSLAQASPLFEAAIDRFRDWTSEFQTKFPDTFIGPRQVTFTEFYLSNRVLYSWGRASGGTGLTSLGIDCQHLADTHTPGIERVEQPGGAPGPSWWTIATPQRVDAIHWPVAEIVNSMILGQDRRLVHLRGKGLVHTISGSYHHLFPALEATAALSTSGTTKCYMHGDTPIEFQFGGQIIGVAESYFSGCAYVQNKGLVGFPPGLETVSEDEIELVLSAQLLAGLDEKVVQIVTLTQSSEFQGQYVPKYDWVIMMLTASGSVYLIDPFLYLEICGPSLEYKERQARGPNADQLSFEERFKVYRTLEKSRPRHQTQTLEYPMSDRVSSYVDQGSGVRMYQLIYGDFELSRPHTRGRSRNATRLVKIVPFQMSLRLAANNDDRLLVLHASSEVPPGYKRLRDDDIESVGFVGLGEDRKVYFVSLKTLRQRALPGLNDVVNIVVADNAEGPAAAERRYSCVYALDASGSLYTWGYEPQGHGGLGLKPQLDYMSLVATKGKYVGVDLMLDSASIVSQMDHPSKWTGIHPFVLRPRKIQMPGKVKDIATTYRAMMAIVSED